MIDKGLEFVATDLRPAFMGCILTKFGPLSRGQKQLNDFEGEKYLRNLAKIHQKIDSLE